MDRDRLRLIEESAKLRFMCARIEDLKTKGKTSSAVINALENQYLEDLHNFIVNGSLPVRGFDGPSCTGGE